ncbi:MAG: hypothetical protein Kow0029_21350 [Candidatus Rifleibacteriota bacterium]
MNSPRKAVTLIEIMLALLIMAGAMIPIASLMGYGGKATSKDARRIAAIQILDKTLRQILQEPFADIPVGKNIQVPFKNVRLGAVKSEQGQNYTVILNSSFVNPTNFAYCGVNVNRPSFKGDNPVAADFLAAETLTLSDVVLRVEVTVQWVEQGNLPVSVSAVTFRANFKRRTG